MNSFFRLLRYAKPYKGRLAWAVLAMMIYAIASALVIYLIRPILDQLLPIRRRRRGDGLHRRTDHAAYYGRRRLRHG